MDADLKSAVTELIIVAGRVSIDLPVSEAEELSAAINRATNALAASPPDVKVQTREEWAVWFDADDPNSPEAEVDDPDTTEEAGRAWLRACQRSTACRGLCRRTVTTYTSPWTRVEDGERR